MKCVSSLVRRQSSAPHRGDVNEVKGSDVLITRTSVLATKRLCNKIPFHSIPLCCVVLLGFMWLSGPLFGPQTECNSCLPAWPQLLLILAGAWLALEYPGMPQHRHIFIYYWRRDKLLWHWQVRCVRASFALLMRHSSSRYSTPEIWPRSVQVFCSLFREEMARVGARLGYSLAGILKLKTLLAITHSSTCCMLHDTICRTNGITFQSAKSKDQEQLQVQLGRGQHLRSWLNSVYQASW